MKGEYEEDLGNEDEEFVLDEEVEEWKPFTPKPKHLKADHINRKKKWEENKASIDEKDISHRRFNCTLHVNQVVTSFKKCVHNNEIQRDALITCYRVVLQKILQDPDLSDEEFISMYKVIQSRANEVYARRSRKMSSRIKV